MATAAPISSSQTVVSPRGSTRAARRVPFRVTPCDWCYMREMILPMSIGLIVMVLVLAGNYVYWAINSIINQGMSIQPVLRLFLLAMPGFAVQGIPVGVILGVCLILNRAVRDNEITALRVGGASLHRIVLPFFAVALMASLADWYIVEHVAPVTNNKAEKAMASMMSQSVAPLIEADKYFRVGNYYFYVQSVENGVLKNVMIYERGSGNYTSVAPTTFPTVLIAKRAYENPKKANQWILENVVHHAYDEAGRQRFEFASDQDKIDVGRELSTYWADQKQPWSMTGNELKQKIEDLDNAAFDRNKLQEWKVDYYRRVALPFACFVMALAAAPLALRHARHGSFAGLVLAFLLAFLWQGIDSWFRALGIGGYLPPMVAAWGTNGLFMLAALGLLWRER